MGYYKNKLIAEQVELGDREPAPRPASTHVAYNAGVTSRRFVRNMERQHNEYHNARMILAATTGLTIGIACGFTLGWLA